MALEIKDDVPDELSQLLKEPRKNTRHDVWLWLYLNHNERANLPSSTCNGSTMRDEIASFLKDNTYILERLGSAKDRHLVHDDYLNWIEKKDKRQYQWLVSRIEDITDLSPGRGLPRALPHLTGETHLIAMLDLWALDATGKTKTIERLRKEWLLHKAKDSDFEWFADKKDETKRCICAWEWLEKNRRSITHRPLPFSNYKGLLIYFDEAGFGPNDQKAIIQNIKKRWNRKQFDERAPDKKQCNVMLSIKVIDQLDKLGDAHGMKRAQVLECLITMESETGMYLDDA